jgi:hypothetical protein
LNPQEEHAFLSFTGVAPSQGLHVRVVDSGEGIDNENLGRVFDPFFTTRSYAHHVGLGLSVAVGILKEHSAQLKIQSQRGQGTQIDILFSSESKALVKRVEDSTQPLDVADLPVELPRLNNVSQEQVADTMKNAEKPVVSLVDRNVDSFLELPAEDEPLQFLSGMGFEDDPPPTAPLPVVEKQFPLKPIEPPPLIVAEAVAEPTVVPSALIFTLTITVSPTETVLRDDSR